MKKVVCAIVAFLSFTCVYSQSFNYGVSLSYNRSTIIYEFPSFQNNGVIYKSGFEGALLFDFSLSKNMGIRFSPGYANRGEKTSGFNIQSVTYPEQNHNFNYIVFPIQFRYNPIDKISLLLGPEVSYLESAKDENGNDFLFLLPNRTEYGINVGAFYKITNNIELGAKYYKGFISPYGEWKHTTEDGTFIENYGSFNQSFSFTLNYLFN